MTDKQNYFTYTDNTSDNNDNIMENLHKQLKRNEQKLEKVKKVVTIHKEQRCITCEYYDDCVNCDDILLQIIEDKL